MRKTSLFCAVLISLLSICASSQVATGTPPFNSFGGGPFDTINLGNLNVHFSIPVIHKAGRGLDFTYDLSYDSSIYTAASVNGTLTWTPAPNFGWRGQTEAAVGYVTHQIQITKCPILGDGSETFWLNYVYHDMFGVAHPFVGEAVANDCNGNSTGFSASAQDGTGYVITVSNTLGVTITSAAGTVRYPAIDIPTGSGLAQDANGNQITVSSSGVFTDTLGTTALTISGGAPNPLVFTYTSPTGSKAYSMNYSSYSVKTAFGCSGIAEYTGTVSLVHTVSLPDGSDYTFDYEKTSAGFYTGRLKSVTLPSGGTITYTYTGGTNGIVCGDGSTPTLTRAVIIFHLESGRALE